MKSSVANRPGLSTPRRGGATSHQQQILTPELIVTAATKQKISRIKPPSAGGFKQRSRPSSASDKGGHLAVRNGSRAPGSQASGNVQPVHTAQLERRVQDLQEECLRLTQELVANRQMEQMQSRADGNWAATFDEQLPSTPLVSSISQVQAPISPTASMPSPAASSLFMIKQHQQRAEENVSALLEQREKKRTDSSGNSRSSAKADFSRDKSGRKNMTPKGGQPNSKVVIPAPESPSPKEGTVGSGGLEKAFMDLGYLAADYDRITGMADSQGNDTAGFGDPSGMFGQQPGTEEGVEDVDSPDLMPHLEMCFRYVSAGRARVAVPAVYEAVRADDALKLWLHREVRPFDDRGEWIHQTLVDILEVILHGHFADDISWPEFYKYFTRAGGQGQVESNARVASDTRPQSNLQIDVGNSVASATGESFGAAPFVDLDATPTSFDTEIGFLRENLNASQGKSPQGNDRKVGSPARMRSIPAELGFLSENLNASQGKSPQGHGVASPARSIPASGFTEQPGYDADIWQLLALRRWLRSKVCQRDSPEGLEEIAQTLGRGHEEVTTSEFMKFLKKVSCPAVNDGTAEAICMFLDPHGFGVLSLAKLLGPESRPSEGVEDDPMSPQRATVHAEPDAAAGGEPQAMNFIKLFEMDMAAEAERRQIAQEAMDQSHWALLHQVFDRMLNDGVKKLDTRDAISEILNDESIQKVALEKVVDPGNDARGTIRTTLRQALTHVDATHVGELTWAHLEKLIRDAPKNRRPKLEEGIPGAKTAGADGEQGTEEALAWISKFDAAQVDVPDKISEPSPTVEAAPAPSAMPNADDNPEEAIAWMETQLAVDGGILRRLLEQFQHCRRGRPAKTVPKGDFLTKLSATPKLIEAMVSTNLINESMLEKGTIMMPQIWYHILYFIRCHDSDVIGFSDVLEIVRWRRDVSLNNVDGVREYLGAQVSLQKQITGVEKEIERARQTRETGPGGVNGPSLDAAPQSSDPRSRQGDGVRARPLSAHDAPQSSASSLPPGPAKTAESPPASPSEPSRPLEHRFLTPTDSPRSDAVPKIAQDIYSVLPEYMLDYGDLDEVDPGSEGRPNQMHPFFTPDEYGDDPVLIPKPLYENMAIPSIVDDRQAYPVFEDSDEELQGAPRVADRGSGVGSMLPSRDDLQQPRQTRFATENNRDSAGFDGERTPRETAVKYRLDGDYGSFLEDPQATQRLKEYRQRVADHLGIPVSAVQLKVHA